MVFHRTIKMFEFFSHFQNFTFAIIFARKKTRSSNNRSFHLKRAKIACMRTYTHTFAQYLDKSKIIVQFFVVAVAAAAAAFFLICCKSQDLLLFQKDLNPSPVHTHTRTHINRHNDGAFGRDFQRNSTTTTKICPKKLWLCKQFAYTMVENVNSDNDTI